MSSSTIEVHGTTAQPAPPAVAPVAVPETQLRPVPAPAPERAPRPEQALGTVAVLGMGYVGLPTSLALAGAGFNVVGVDVSERRLDAIRSGPRHAASRPRAPGARRRFARCG